MATPAYVGIEMVRGDSLGIPLTFLDPSDPDLRVPVNDYFLRFTVKVSKHQPDEQAVILKEIVLPPEAANGEYVLNLTPDDTNGLEPMSYDYDIQISTPDKAQVVTLVQGKIKVMMSASWGN